MEPSPAKLRHKELGHHEFEDDGADLVTMEVVEIGPSSLEGEEEDDEELMLGGPGGIVHDEHVVVETMEEVDGRMMVGGLHDIGGGVVAVEVEINSGMSMTDEEGNNINDNPDLQVQLEEAQPVVLQRIVSTVTPEELMEPTFSCPHCPRMFNRRNMVTRHVNEIHKIDLAFKCDLCDKTFSVIPSLQKHLMNFHKVDPEPYECSNCHDTFTLQSLLEEHNCPKKVKDKPMKKVEKVEEEMEKVVEKKEEKKQQGYHCKVCRKVIRTKSAMKRHVASHFKCSYCKRSVSSQDNLQKHLKTHEGDVDDDEKHHCCPYCSKKYYCEENFKLHLRFHSNTNDKPWGCERCDLRFKQEDKYTKHLEKCKVLWTCVQCGKEFVKKGAWARHEKGCPVTQDTDTQEDTEENPQTV